MVVTARTFRNSLSIACIFFFSTLAMAAQAPTETTSLAPGCKVANNLYTCNTESFQQTLAKAKTAAIQTGPVDPAAQAQLKKLFVALGLTAPAEGQPADLTFLLVPVDAQSVAYNTGDTAVGALHIFAHGSGPGRGDLVWAENFTGSQDLPWPIVVNRLVLQFRSRFHIKDAPKAK
jgi:hypothetical protein